MTKRIGIGQTLTLSRFCWYLQLYNPQANSLFCMAAICLVSFLPLFNREIVKTSFTMLACLFIPWYIWNRYQVAIVLSAAGSQSFGICTYDHYNFCSITSGKRHMLSVYVRWWISSFNLICTLRRIWILVSPTYLKDYIRYLYQYVLLVALSLCTLDHV